jgi:hypothetical protein
MNSAEVRGHGLMHFYFDRTKILKLLAFKQMIRKILNRSAAHI